MKNKRVKFKWFIHRHYIYITIIAFAATMIVTVYLFSSGADWKLLLPVVGVLISFIYFIQKHQLDEARLFKDLFLEFNARYDALNAGLHSIMEKESSEPLSSTEKHHLFDYFNLCAEEYLFYCKGYIYPEVWMDWLNGMHGYYLHPRIQKLWHEETNQTDSYYGFNICEQIEEMTKRSSQNKFSA